MGWVKRFAIFSLIWFVFLCVWFFISVSYINSHPLPDGELTNDRRIGMIGEAIGYALIFGIAGLLANEYRKNAQKKKQD